MKVSCKIKVLANKVLVTKLNKNYKATLVLFAVVQTIMLAKMKY